MVSISDDIRRRLEEANRRPLRESPADGAALDQIRRRLRGAPTEPSAPARPEIVYHRSLPTVAARPVSERLQGRSFVDLETGVQGTDIAVPGYGRAYVAVRASEDVGRHGASVGDAFAAAPWRALLSARGCPDVGDEELRPGDLLFADLETTGLGGAQVFLAGLMSWTGDTFSIRQYLARNYAEEAAVTAQFAEEIATCRVLVTFNGKTFDLPTARARGCVHKVDVAFDGLHFDLLHESRRAWRHQLPDCRLQTLEALICGRRRVDDLPGSEVPEAYREYVRTGNAVEIVRILAHNANDLLTLADILCRLPEPAEAP